MNKLPLDADAQLADRTSSEAAEALLWWRRVPELPGERIGVIGGFQATGPTAAAGVLAQACNRLSNESCTLTIGPMDGNTWRSYRFVTDPGTEPPFLLEPSNPPEWPAWWRAAGFNPLAEYFSTATNDLSLRDERLSGAMTRLRATGVRLRAFDGARFEAELERIYDVSVISFRENFLYTPLSREDFLAQYRALKEKLRPELVVLAEHAERPVGYVFAIPDYAQAQRGEPVSTVIVKTLAVLPGRAYAGLGAWLLAESHQAAQRLGFTRAIHALMHEPNKSRNLSARYAQTIRRYTLFARKLTDEHR